MYGTVLSCSGTDGDAELKIVVLTAAAGSQDETMLRLALIAGVSEPARG